MKRFRFVSGLMVLVLLVLSMESCMGQGVTSMASSASATLMIQTISGSCPPFSPAG